jgi:hypothetical protein
MASSPRMQSLSDLTRAVKQALESDQPRLIKVPSAESQEAEAVITEPARQPGTSRPGGIGDHAVREDASAGTVRSPAERVALLLRSPAPDARRDAVVALHVMRRLAGRPRPGCSRSRRRSASPRSRDFLQEQSEPGCRLQS